MVKRIIKWVKRQRVLFNKEINLSVLDEIFGIFVGLPLTYLIITGGVSSNWFILPFICTLIYVVLLVIVIHLKSVDDQMKFGCYLNLIYFIIAALLLSIPGLSRDITENILLLITSGFIWITFRYIIIKFFIMMHGEENITIK